MYSILAIFIFPIFWSFPHALITAELCSVVKDDQGVGFVVWIDMAFGKFVSFQAGFWSCICNVLDKALYPVLFIDYLQFLFLNQNGGATEFSPFVRWVLCTILVIFVVVVNLRGLEVVGAASVVFFFLTLAPFLLLCFWSLPQVTPSVWFEGSSENIQWGMFISTLMWNGSGWDSVGLLSAETIDSKRIFPIAIIISMVLVNGTHLLPILFCTSIDKDWYNWRDGEFERIAYMIGGSFLQTFFIIGAAACCVGIFVALLTTSSRQMYSMSRTGLLPPIFGKLHSTWGTPWFAIIFNGVIVSILTMFPFQQLLEVSVISNAVITALTFMSFIALRRSYCPLPDERSRTKGLNLVDEDSYFRMPLSTRNAAIYVSIPILFSLFGIYASSMLCKLCSIGFLLAGSVLYFTCRQGTSDKEI
eukprot:TRINITY_DN6252_c0_g1_i1.p1 TRINITY_DN6252_c0_g1~~TRINITY_DN6252_c0_g1_i1.p1  ORF type:complete len:480 (+),score=128.92 TRINITY_DN6252_c0_g1_i1:190-1440(+)